MRGIVVLLVLLVFVFGCAFGDSGDKSVRRGFGSSSGVSVTFVEDQPPKDTSAGKPIPFSLKVRNAGLQEISSGGFSARLVGLDTYFSPSELQGSNANILKEIDESGISDDSTVELGFTTYNPEQMFDDRIFKSGELNVEFCYPYKTFVIVDNFWIGSKTSDVSKGSISSNSNSNAPVQVVELKEVGSVTSTDFTFKVKAAGKGKVVSKCFPTTDEDKAKVVNLNMQLREASCYYVEGDGKKPLGSDGPVVLNNVNEKIIHCSVPFSGEKPIKSQLQMELSYTYQDSIQVPALIIRRF